jgi:hypothetical protein
MGERLTCQGRARLSMWSYNAWEVADETTPEAKVRIVSIELESKVPNGRATI